MQKIRKKSLKKVMGLILVLTMIFTTQLTAFASNTKQKTVTSHKSMTLFLIQEKQVIPVLLHLILAHFPKMQL